MKKICFIFCCFFMFTLNVFADDLYSISYNGSGALEVRKNNVATSDYASALTADSSGNIVLKEGVAIDTISTVNKSINITSNNKEISINSITVGTGTSSNLTINNAKLNFGGAVTSSGNITISSSTLNITGGDFEATGNMSITNSTIKGNAHRYHSNGTLNVSDSSIQGLINVASDGNATFDNITTNTTTNKAYGHISSNSNLVITNSDIKTESLILSNGAFTVTDTTINVPVCRDVICGIADDNVGSSSSKLTNVTIKGEGAIACIGSVELDNITMDPSFIVFESEYNGSKIASGSVLSLMGYLKVKNSNLNILHTIGALKDVEIIDSDINFDLDSLADYIKENNISSFIYGIVNFQQAPTTDYKVTIDNSNLTGNAGIATPIPVEIKSSKIDSEFIELDNGNIIGSGVGCYGNLTIEQSDIDLAVAEIIGNTSVDSSKVVFSIMTRMQGNLDIKDSIFILDNREVDNTFKYPVYVSGNTNINNSTVKFISQYDKAAFTTSGSLTIDEKMVKIDNNKNELSLLKYSSVPTDINISVPASTVYYLGTGTNTESTYDILTTYKKVTFKIKNGTWADGSNDDIVIEVEFGHVLTEDDIPVGMKAFDNTYTGRWEEGMDNYIVDDTTFNYIFEKVTNPKTGVRQVLVPLLLLSLGLILLRREIIDNSFYHKL